METNEKNVNQNGEQNGKKHPDRVLTAVYHVRSAALALEKAISFDYKTYKQKKGQACSELATEDVEELQELHDRIMAIRNKYGQNKGGGPKKPNKSELKKIFMALEPQLTAEQLNAKIDQAMQAV